MLQLALDTATRHASVAICQNNMVLAEDSREVTTHSEGLMILIDQTFKAAGKKISDLDAITCGRGPGSFTGLRIGLATAKGLCLAAEVPLICISSLQALALAARTFLPEHPYIAALLDARRKEVFFALYKEGRLQQPETVCLPDELAQILPKLVPQDQSIVLVGDGVQTYQTIFTEQLEERMTLPPEPCHIIQARYLAEAAVPRYEAGDFDDLQEAVPLYIRASDACLPTIKQDKRQQ